jgi:hypothetical protein
LPARDVGVYRQGRAAAVCIRRRGPAQGALAGQSRRYIEDFEQALATSGAAREVIEKMLAKYPEHGNRYTLFISAATHFSS